MAPSPRLTFVVHGIDQARLALAIATELGVPVYLRSAEGAGLSLGAPWFREMITAALCETPSADAIGVLDCGAYAGVALSAFRHGVKYVRVEVDSAVEGRLTQIANYYGGALVAETCCQPLVDLDSVAKPLTIRQILPIIG